MSDLRSYVNTLYKIVDEPVDNIHFVIYKDCAIKMQIRKNCLLIFARNATIMSITKTLAVVKAKTVEIFFGG